jgi:glucose/arabinose dehydrogenase
MLAAVPAGFEDTVVAGGFYLPTSMTFAPDGRLFVTEKGGTVKVVENGNCCRRRSDGASKHLFGAGLESIGWRLDARLRPLYTPRRCQRLSQFCNEKFNIADPGVTGDPRRHSPAAAQRRFMQWGNDGMLYLGVGDALVEANVQDLGSLSGKILRLDITNYPGIVPADNPFVNTPGARPEIYALGLRNPFTSAIQPSTGRLFVNDVGAASWEEVNDVQAGKNYGWPNAEGASGNPAYVDPIYAYSHNGGSAAVTGAEFYEANQFPASYFGSYFFANFISGQIFRMDTLGGNAVTTFATGASRPVDFDVAADGTMNYLAFGDGTVHRIRYVGDGNRSPTACRGDQTGPAPLPSSSRPRPVIRRRLRPIPELRRWLAHAAWAGTLPCTSSRIYHAQVP